MIRIAARTVEVEDASSTSTSFPVEAKQPIFYSLGICWHRTAFATRSASYLFLSTRTTCHTSRIAVRERSSRASVVGICRVWWHVALRRESSPYRQRANRLKREELVSEVQGCSLKSTHQSDSSRARRSAS
jgi:hypothetical protein